MNHSLILERNYSNINSPIECYKLNIIAVYCCILFITSILVNSKLLYVFYTTKNLRTSLNRFVIVLTGLDLIGSLIELPFVIISNFSCGWIFGKIGCILSGFIMTFVGMSSIYLMTAIVLDRYYNLSNLIPPINDSCNGTKHKSTFFVLFVCLAFGLFWALAPIFGWSYYTLEVKNNFLIFYFICF